MRFDDGAADRKPDPEPASLPVPPSLPGVAADPAVPEPPVKKPRNRGRIAAVTASALLAVAVVAGVGYTVVTVNGIPLNPRLDLWNHSPTGFEWGYGGSGPAQLALALLADHLGDDAEALALCEPFMQRVVAELDNSWELTSADIDAALAELGR